MEFFKKEMNNWLGPTVKWNDIMRVLHNFWDSILTQQLIAWADLDFISYY